MGRRSQREKSRATVQDHRSPAIRVMAAPHLKPPPGRSGLSWFWWLFWLLFWLSAAALVSLTGWTALRLILDPASVLWLRNLGFHTSGQPLSRDDGARSLSDWKTQAATTGLRLDTAIPLGPTGAVLLPATPHLDSCFQGERQSLQPMPCDAIRELQLYRSASSRLPLPTYRLLHRIPVSGLRESTVLIGLSTTGFWPDPSRRLPYTAIAPISGPTPNMGIWLQFQGQWQRGNRTLLYGQVVTYEPLQNRLTPQLTWSTQAGVAPYWQEVSNGGAAELVLEQTVGLEPKFIVYQVIARPETAHPLQLEAIALTQPALPEPAFQDALILARSGLWSPALRLLTGVKNQQTHRWTAPAQAQLDVIHLHASATQTQARQQWASPAQQITAQLIDGQWQDALQRLQDALSAGFDPTMLFSHRSDQLWRRVNAALQVNPNQPDVQTWGAMILAAREGSPTAIAWLQQFPQAVPPPQSTVRLLQYFDGVAGMAP